MTQKLVSRRSLIPQVVYYPPFFFLPFHNLGPPANMSTFDFVLLLFRSVHNTKESGKSSWKLFFCSLWWFLEIFNGTERVIWVSLAHGKNGSSSIFGRWPVWETRLPSISALCLSRWAAVFKQHNFSNSLLLRKIKKNIISRDFYCLAKCAKYTEKRRVSGQQQLYSM